MTIEQRLASLEKRLQAAEDQLEIIRLLNTYGPLVDSGESQKAAGLWVEDGRYDFSGYPALTGHEQLAAMYDSEGHHELINTGCSHLTATPCVTVNGDSADAVAYSYVVLREGDRWYLWRASVNHWTLTRTAQGWKIKERFNRVLDGSEDSHDTMRKVLTQ